MVRSNKTGYALDVEVALAHVDGDRQLLAELSAMFLQDYPRLIQETQNAIQQSDYASLERAAHTLKGRLAFFGVLKSRRRVLELERMGREKDLTGAREALDEVRGDIEGVLPEFESLSREQEK